MQTTTPTTTAACLRCGTDRPGEINALSRKDNETYICTSCGTDEGMCDWHGLDVWPNYPRPIAPDTDYR